eukprot:CAMPEP_0202878614 /NCGR_PEP_ID=MMETSP1391-20130828/32472_1 /ASSEMBLY_ACC=CAM_ASM_000867 /TAXON_ID=1034604 /ORGANISM="Chlamydomonas leiostraca, Strain SAG 11-49" /LENGTH=40 /DNA_ID= /DNA_START= /DNA_END= /DNA_ORIENTATION=
MQMSKMVWLLLTTHAVSVSNTKGRSGPDVAPAPVLTMTSR